MPNKQTRTPKTANQKKSKQKTHPKPPQNKHTPPPKAQPTKKAQQTLETLKVGVKGILSNFFNCFCP